MNWDWTKVGKGLVLIRWKLIQNDWLVVVFVCLFMSAPGASLTHFTFIFFLKVIVLSTRFYCRIVSGKSAWKPSGETSKFLQIGVKSHYSTYFKSHPNPPPPTKPLKPDTNRMFQNIYWRLGIKSSRGIYTLGLRSKISLIFTSGLNLRPEVKVNSSKNSNF